MFTLIYGLYEYIFKREEYHILILGLDKAGKTNVRSMQGIQISYQISVPPLQRDNNYIFAWQRLSMAPRTGP